MALLLDRSRFGVALCDDQPAWIRTVFTGNFLPCRLALVGAEIHLTLGLGGSEEDAPAIVRHPYVVKVCPALRIDADRGAQIDVGSARALGPHLAPPVQELGVPVL